jgi:archaeosine-15-forming tRNA-guanine transglycosylase
MCVTRVSFIDVVVTPLSLPASLKAEQGLVYPAQEEERKRRGLERQRYKPVRRAFTMRASKGYLYCGGESAHVVAQELHSESDDVAT